MPETANQTYRRLGGRRWLRWQSDDGWLAADHLLFVRTRFFSEQYTRLYWNDVQALLLYPFARNTGLMLGAEVLVVAAAIAVAVVQKRFEVMVVALCYLAFYAAWRLTRRNYGVQMLTRTATVRIPLAMFHRSARRLVDQLEGEVEGVQGHPPRVPEMPVFVGEGEASAGAVTVDITAAVKPSGTRRRPILVLHGIVFGLGLITSVFVTMGLLSDPQWTAIGILLSMLFYGGLLATFFLQQDPEFPFAVRSAVVMNFMLVGSMSGAVLAVGPGLNTPEVGMTLGGLMPPVALLQLLACLFGLIGIYKNSLDESDKPLATLGTGSNSLA